MNLKEVKQRIASVKNTQKITSAMKLVSAAKLRRSQAAIEGMRQYSEKLDEMLQYALGNVNNVNNAYTVAREVKRAAIVPVSSDTGLCGAFNSNVARLTQETIEKYRASGVAVEVFPVGHKIESAVKKMGFVNSAPLLQHLPSLQYTSVASAAKVLMQRFVSGEIDCVELIYTRLRSASKLTAVSEMLLPLPLPAVNEDIKYPEFIVEPSATALLSSLIPKVVSQHLYSALLNSHAAEHSARMIAMQTATDNAEELIAELTLEYNKGRQQAITNEILDIVSGSSGMQ